MRSLAPPPAAVRRAAAAGIGALPTTVFVDAAGIVVGVYNGLLTEGRLARFVGGYSGVVVRSSTPDRSRFRSPATAPP